MKGMSHFRSLWHTLVHCMHSIQHRSLKSASPCTELPRFLLGRGAAGSNSGINGLTSLARDEVHNLSLTDSPGYFLFTLLVFITSQSFLVPGATCFRFERHFCTGKRYAKYEGDLLQTLCAFWTPAPASHFVKWNSGRDTLAQHPDLCMPMLPLLGPLIRF